MVKRGRLALLVFIGFLLIAAGCGRQASIPAVSSPGPDARDNDIIPFLFFCNDHDKNVVARDALWNLDDGSIQIKSSIRYKVKHNADGDVDAIKPLVWDGQNNFTLHEGAMPVQPSICQAQILKAKHHGTVWGKKVTAIVNIDNKGVKTYDLELQDAEHTQVKQLSIVGMFKDASGNPMPVGDDEEVRSIDYSGDKVRFVFMNIYGQSLRAYIAYYSPVDSSITWDEIPFPEDNEVMGDNYACNTVTVNDKMYLQTGEASIEELDFREKRLSKPTDLVKNAKLMVSDAVQPIQALPMRAWGEYNDVVILLVPVNTGSRQWELLTCAVKDDKVLGALHFRDDQVKSYNSTKQVVAVKSLKDLNLFNNGPTVYFPNKFNMVISTY